MSTFFAKGITAISGAAVVAALLAGCGNSASADIAKCIEHTKSVLKESGSTRALTQGEIDACNDPDSRKFILGK